MPVLNGFELCKKIREVDRTVHIIFITASEAYYEKFRGQHFLELGKINHIQKPIGNEETNTDSKYDNSEFNNYRLNLNTYLVWSIYY